MGGETPIAREGLVSSYKNVCGEYAGCMLSFLYIVWKTSKCLASAWVYGVAF